MDGYDRFRSPSAADDAASERHDIATRLEDAAKRITSALDELRDTLLMDVAHHEWPGADEGDALHAEAMADRAEKLLAQVAA
jgi:hypothetical protein